MDTGCTATNKMPQPMAPWLPHALSSSSVVDLKSARHAALGALSKASSSTPYPSDERQSQSHRTTASSANTSARSSILFKTSCPAVSGASHCRFPRNPFTSSMIDCLQAHHYSLLPSVHFLLGLYSRPQAGPFVLTVSVDRVLLAHRG